MTRVHQQDPKPSQVLRITRSELYARALCAYLEEHKAGGITERLDAVYAGESSEEDRPDLYLGRMRAESVPAEDGW